MQRKLLVGFILLISGLSQLMGQTNKYNITLTINNIEDKKLYLKGYYGAEEILIDSSKVRKGTITFNRALAVGEYQIVNADGERYCSFLAHDSHHFSIKTNKDNYKQTLIEGSPENKQYFLFQAYIATATNLKNDIFLSVFAQNNPQSLVAQIATLTQHYYQTECPYTDNYFESIPWHAPLLHLPYAHTIISQFFNEPLSDQSAAAQIAKVDLFYSKCDVQSEVGQYYLKWLLYKYLTDSNPEWDIVFVHLYEQYLEAYGCTFLDDVNVRILKRNVVRKKRVMRGSTVPALEVMGDHEKVESTANISNRYTLLWFWDPDCEDCLIETPRLHDFYLQHSETYDFEVFAVALTVDFERWHKIIADMQLSWINTCDGDGNGNYDFRDHFNILTTPCSFLIDNEHKIILQQFSLEQLQSFFENQ